MNEVTMVYEKQFKKYGFESIVAYSGKDINDNMLEESFGVSDGFFGQRYSIKESNIRDVVKNFGRMCLIIKDRDEGKVIGYSFWVPIKNEVFVDFIKKKEMLINIEEEYCSRFDEKLINLFSAGEAFVAGYDLDSIHKAIEDIFQEKILNLARNGVMINCVGIESVCEYDEKYLVKFLGLEKKFIKENSIFYIDKYSPKKVYKRSPIAKLLEEYYN